MDFHFVFPRLAISNIQKTKEVDGIVAPLILSKKQINEVRNVFESEMALGLSKTPAKPSCLQMENTYIPELTDGSEQGEFLSLDLGGTNFRVIYLHLEPGKPADYLVKYYTVPEPLRLGKGEDLFDFLAECIYDFMKNNNLLEKKLPLGFCFSFPMVQKALDIGILVTWTKSFNCPDVVGKDAVEMLNNAIDKRGDTNVHVVAVVNDTTGTIMKGAYIDHKCAIGLILGTGCNACYLERIDRIEKWEGEHPGINEVVVDIEWGAFGDNGVLDFVKTEYDRAVDDQSLLVHSFTFEKLFAGKYIGELVRQVLVKLVSKSVLFNGQLPDPMSKNNSFTAADVSNIEGENSGFETTKSILQRLGVAKATDDDAAIVKYVCAIVTIRGAQLVSICLSSLLIRMDKPDVTIAIDGSLYKKHPKLHNLMTHFTSEMAPGKKFHLILAEDGSGKGAGLVAAVAVRLNKNKLNA